MGTIYGFMVLLLLLLLTVMLVDPVQQAEKTSFMRQYATPYQNQIQVFSSPT